MKKTSSLIRRQWLASAICLPILVSFSAFTLNRAFVHSLDSAESDALLAQVYSLIALAEPSDTTLFLPSYLSNPRLETPESGLYARVVDTEGRIAWRSNSLEASPIYFDILQSTEPGQALFSNLKLEQGHDFRALSFSTIWELGESDRSYTFEVFHSQSNKQKEIRSYQRALLSWLGGMAFLLILVQIAIAKWGLRPLKKLAREIEAIEKGEKNDLEGDYPKEISPVTQSLNQLLASEIAQRSRYKNALSDLAHSLKTPLAVIRSQLDNSEKDKTIDGQVERMSTIVSHQLRRASAEVKSIYGPQTDITNVITRLCTALGKVYPDKQLDFDHLPDQQLSAQVQENDLMEVLGNIIENACKYGSQKIRVNATVDQQFVYVYIEDDGDGIPESLHQSILRRGARADTSKHGQGIGLAVAVDILSSYNGALKITASELGGAKFEVCLPAT